MAKFKEGDRVVEIPSRFGTMGTGTVEWCEGNPKEPQRARVRFDRGGTWVVDTQDLRAANAAHSTNSIVAKALNAVARNYKPTSEFEVGDIVRFKDSVRSVPHDETYEVIKVRDKNITIKGGRDNGTSTEFANNLEIVENADIGIARNAARNAKFKVGDKVFIDDVFDDESGFGPFSWTGKRATVVGFDGPYTKVKLPDGSVKQFAEKELKAANAVGGNIVGTRWVAKDDPLFIVRVLSESSGKVRVQSADGGTCTYSDDEFERIYKLVNAARARNAEFNVGDRVRIKNPNRQVGQDDGTYEVILIRPDGLISVKAPSEKVGFAVRPEKLVRNTEDAQGHEHGDDGKFTSKDGGSSGDGYEDPKTKRMKERLAKMREKNEALRKEIEARKAGLAQKKADSEKMRSDIMKANVERWKASLKSRNSVVAKALNAATAKNAISDKEREYTRLYELAQKNITFHAAKGDSAKAAEWKRKADEYKRLAQEAEDSATARNADFPIEKFEVGKTYRAPRDRNWLAKVLSRTDSSIKVAIKSVRDKTWHKADEQVTLRINPRKSEEQGAEVAKGWDWEFWADVKA